MRLIDADAVKFNFQYGCDDNGVLLVPYRDAKKLIEAAKTVDAVPVVRCKDCKHYRNYPNGLCYLHTEPKTNSRGYSGDAVCVEPEDFCSYGERKEGAEC